MSIIEVIARAAGAFTVLLIMTRLLGRKQISQLTFFNYITGITIGSIAAMASVSPSVTFTNGIVSLLTWGSLTLLIAYINFKSKKARMVIDGQPEIVIKDGKIMEGSLKKLRLDMDELNLLLRNQKVFSIQDVDYAILETNGRLSLMKKSDYQTVTKQDINIQKAKNNATQVPTELIVDGKISSKNLQKLNLDEQWLNQQLQKAGVDSVSDVVFAQYQKDGSLYIDKKNDNVIH